MAEDKIVEVTWLDTCYDEGHPPIELASELCYIERKNVGYLKHSDDDKVVLLFGYLINKNKQVTASDVPIAIARGCIKSIREL